MSENVAGGTVETPTQEINWEERAMKAEAKIVELKKSQKPGEDIETPEVKEVQTTPEAPDFNTQYAEVKFFENNPDLSEYKEQLSGYVDHEKGIGWGEARALLEMKDETFKNRNVAKKMNFTAWDAPKETNVVTVDMLEKANDWEYNRLMDLVESGKATLTN